MLKDSAEEFERARDPRNNMGNSGGKGTGTLNGDGPSSSSSVTSAATAAALPQLPEPEPDDECQICYTQFPNSSHNWEVSYSISCIRISNRYWYVFHACLYSYSMRVCMYPLALLEQE